MIDPDKPNDGPETQAEADHWQRRNNRYVRLGLCYPCAAQCAYGHQLGFSRIHPPCEACQPIVDTFPYPAVGPWRKVLDPGDAKRHDAKAATKAST